VWKNHLSKGNIEMFPPLLQIQDQSDYKEVIPFGITDRQPWPILSFFVIIKYARGRATY
jgi:hypothetical protein